MLTRSALAPGTTAAAANRAPKLRSCNHYRIQTADKQCQPELRAEDEHDRPTYLTPRALLAAGAAGKVCRSIGTLLLRAGLQLRSAQTQQCTSATLFRNSRQDSDQLRAVEPTLQAGWMMRQEPAWLQLEVDCCVRSCKTVFCGLACQATQDSGSRPIFLGIELGTLAGEFVN